MEEQKIMLSVILPTYNEVENIVDLIIAIQENIASLDNEIIVVDDDSPDLTWSVVEEKFKEVGHVSVIRRTHERGLTSAINAGLKASKGQYVTWMDCDFSHPPAIMLQMYDMALSENKVVIASRFVKGGSDSREGDFLIQRYLSLVLSFMSRWLVGLKVLDITSGYLVCEKKHLENIDYLRGDYGEYFIEMCSRLQKNNIVFHEFPYTFKNREKGESKTATNLFGLFKRGLKYIGVMITVSRS
jgi:dolichol-phosphate mannosyltransferase